MQTIKKIIISVDIKTEHDIEQISAAIKKVCITDQTLKEQQNPKTLNLIIVKKDSIT